MTRRAAILSHVLTCAALAAALLFIVSGCLKALDAEGFARTLGLHHNSPNADLRGAAWLVTLAECAAGLVTLALLMGKRSRAAGALASLLFLAFSAYAAWMIVHPPAKPAGCGCGFAQELLRPDGWNLILARNALVTASFAILVRFTPAPPVPRATA